VDVELAKSMMGTCIKGGINFFDNAEVYAAGKAEEVMGQAIQEMGVERSDIVLSTKIFWGGGEARCPQEIVCCAVRLPPEAYQGAPTTQGSSRKHSVRGFLEPPA